MAEQQESFILYLDELADVDKLSDREAGQLFRAIITYQATGALPDALPTRADCMFGYIRRNLDRNRAKWEKTREARRNAGRKGGRPRAEQPDDAHDPDPDDKTNKANAFFAFPEKANESNEKQMEAKKAVNVNVPVPVNVNVPVNVPVAEPAQKANASGQEPADRIRYLETMLKLFSYGALDEDRMVIADYKAELARLKGMNT